MRGTKLVSALLVAACALVVGCRNEGLSSRPSSPSVVIISNATATGHIGANGVASHRLRVLGESATNSLTVTITWTDPAVDLDVALVGGPTDTGIPTYYGRYIAAQANAKTGTTERLVYAPTDPRARLTAGIMALIWITNASAQAQAYTIEVAGVSASVDAAQPDLHTYCEEGHGNLCKAATCRYLASSGFSGPVSLSCPYASDGVTCLFTEPIVAPSEREIGQVGLSVVIDPRLPATWPSRLLTIRASGGGVVRDSQITLGYTPPGLGAPGTGEMRVTGCVLPETYDNLGPSLARDIDAQVVQGDGSVRTCNGVRSDYWGFFVFPFGESGCAAKAGDRVSLAVRGRTAGPETPYVGGAWLNTALR